MSETQQGQPASADQAGGRANRLRRLWTLVLLLVLVWAVGQRFIGIAQDPQFQVHSDDLIWMWRFVHLPRPALPTLGTDYARMEYIPAIGLPAADLDYVHGIDQSALERWVFHYLLAWTGKMPGELPEKAWDYRQDHSWNIQQGNVAPASAVHFVRVVNAAFMIGAVVLIFAAVARTTTPFAGFVAGAYIVLHSAVVETLWSIGSDPLMWLGLAAALFLWVRLGASLRGAIFVGLVGGLAACAKLNGALVLVGYVVWLLLKKRPRLAALSGALGFAVFLAVNPILFSRGLFGVPSMLAEMLSWRAIRAELIAVHYPAYSGAPQWQVAFYLIGPWWPLLALLAVARRLWRLEPAVFWGASLAVGHAITVTAPIARYTFPLQAGLVLGLIAAYWPARMSIARTLLASAFARLSGRSGQRPKA